MNKIVLRLLNRTFAFKMLALITAQQLLVAGSTAFLGLAGQHVGRGQVFLWLLCGFFVLTLLPHAFSLWLKKVEMEGYFDAYFNFIHLRLFNNRGHSGKWQNHHQKEKFLTALGPDAEGYLTAVAFSIFDIYLFGLTILLNVTTLALVVDVKFSFAFLVSGLVSFFIFKKYTVKIETLVTEEQEAKTDFFSYILRSWDNVLLNNSIVHKLYEKNLTAKFQATHQNIGRSALRSEGLILILTTVASLPVFVLIFHLTLTNANESAYLTGLLVTIPKQIMILGNFRAFFGQITNLAAFKARFQTCWENSIIDERDFQIHIKAQDIKVNGAPLGSLTRFAEKLSQAAQGRYSISGGNGTGKTTLLLYLNSQLPDSFYLPANPQLEIEAPLGMESTGERVLKHLDFISKQNTPYILLDEWDANLDQVNKAKISQRLEELSLGKIIVEVRH